MRADDIKDCKIINTVFIFTKKASAKVNKKFIRNLWIFAKKMLTNVSWHPYCSIYEYHKRNGGKEVMKKRSTALVMALALAAGAVSGCGALSVGGDTVGESAAPAAEGAEGGESAAASSTGYPSKTVEVIVPFAAGGGADIATRLVCSYLEQELGQTFVINNVSGGGGTIGLTNLVDADPDGYTIAYFSSTDSNGDIFLFWIQSETAGDRVHNVVSGNLQLRADKPSLFHRMGSKAAGYDHIGIHILKRIIKKIQDHFII